MNRYQVEFRVAGSEESWTIEAHDEDEAKRVVDYEYPYDHVTIISVNKLGDCA